MEPQDNSTLEPNSAGGAPEAENTNNGLPDTNTPPVTNWQDGLSDEQKTFVGERDLSELVDYAKSQRQAASEREASIIEKSGLIKPLGSDDDPIAHLKEHYGASSVEDYLKVTGQEEASLSADDKATMEAAIVSGMHPRQYQAFQEQMQQREHDLEVERGQWLDKALEEDWGADASRNTEFAKRAAKQFGLDEKFMEGLSKAADNEQVRSFMNGLARLGEMNSEGGPIPGVGERPAGNEGTPQEQLRAVEETVIAQGGQPTAEQKRRMEALINQISGVAA